MYNTKGPFAIIRRVPHEALHMVERLVGKRHPKIENIIILTVCCSSQRVFCLGSVQSDGTYHYHDHSAALMRKRSKCRDLMIMPGLDIILNVLSHYTYDKVLRDNNPKTTCV